MRDGIVRIMPGELLRAREMFSLPARVFDEDREELDDAYVSTLLDDKRFWALAALHDGHVVAGLTAWTLPLTSRQRYEVFIYDVAVEPAHRRQGCASRLVQSLLELAEEQGIGVAWVPVDNEDSHAIEFYRSISGTPSPVTIFTFGECD